MSSWICYIQSSPYGREGYTYRAWTLLFILVCRVLQEPQLKGISVNNVRAFLVVIYN